jgi:hypothetical protein
MLIGKTDVPRKCLLNKGCFVTYTAMALLMVTGCGPSDPPQLRITGEVRLDQQLVGPVSIVFVRETEGQIGCSIQSSDGLFEVPADLGPSLGNFFVTIQSWEPDLEEFEARRLSGAAPLNQSPIPTKYQKAGALSATVEAEGKNHFIFSLSSNSF